MTDAWATIVVGLLALLGTALGTVASSRLTAYRIEQLERKVDKHNSVIDRMYKAEDRLNLLDEKVKVANHRIDDLEIEKE